MSVLLFDCPDFTYLALFYGQRIAYSGMFSLNVAEHFSNKFMYILFRKTHFEADGGRKHLCFHVTPHIMSSDKCGTFVRLPQSVHVWKSTSWERQNVNSCRPEWLFSEDLPATTVVMGLFAAELPRRVAGDWNVWFFTTGTRLLELVYRV